MQHTHDTLLKARAARVLPNGMYGHQSVKMLPPNAPQFFSRADGAYLWDYDGNRYLDFMCGYGPNLFGYGHAAINAAYVEQLQRVDAATGPSALIVDLAEAFTTMVSHSDWAIFCKNGSDATSMALLIARAYRGRSKVLLARGAYHGSAPWNTPLEAGTVPEDRAHFLYYRYNDTESLRAAVAEAGDELAAIFASPFKHDVLVDQELPTLEFARAAREICDQQDALLVIDDVRAGFRVERESSWHSLGVAPDLSCWGKAIANGHPLSCLLGSDRARDAAASVYVTGSFWFAAAAMAASLKTLELIRDTDYLEQTIRLGQMLRDGLTEIGGRHGLPISQTGPVQMPLVMFNGADGKRDLKLGAAFADGMIKGGAYFHPFHNMFISAAMTPADIEQTLTTADAVARSLPAIA
ncbi:MAG: aminotransferase class III-fold pyridoxal phosphate-dependent enzyme [Pseudomonadota bacterium]